MVQGDKSLTGEPILPSRNAHQYLARYSFAVRDGKVGSPVRDLSQGLFRVYLGDVIEVLDEGAESVAVRRDHQLLS
jgi:hypothetical protein